MRKLLFGLFLVCLFCVPAHTQTLIAAPTGQGITTFTTTGTSTVGANLEIAYVSYLTSSSIPVLSDNLGNTWIPLPTENNITGATAQTPYFATNPIVGTSQTFTLTGTTIAASLIVEAFSGSAIYSDLQNGNIAVSVSTTQAGAIKPRANGALVVMMAAAYGVSTQTMDSGFIYVNVSGASGDYPGAIMGYLAQSSATSVNPTITWGTSGRNSTANIIDFAPARCPAIGFFFAP